ncbi:hypothetical protein AVEN_178467-1 [Araneus ventricosus]|uniref:Uncharacterized protein n=1 Tax=Araneus ventricosus TaxID=182803 RepID=A0A4Y2CFG1_ARAVE|nr:hypothetical protein AVEN_178467-1 [Araneus ventricosus]
MSVQDPSRLLSLLHTGGRRSKKQKKKTVRSFPVSDKNTKENRIVVRIMDKNTRYERVSAVAITMMGMGKWITKDYEIIARWFKLRREKEEGCFTAGPKGQLINENQRKSLPQKTLFIKLKVL